MRKLEDVINAVNSDAVIATMTEMLGIRDTEFPVKAIVVTNRDNYLGSAVIVRRDVQDKLIEIFGGSFLILPSSVHELICIEDSDDVDAYRDMVTGINKMMVGEEDKLSDDPFRFNADTRKIERA